MWQFPFSAGNPLPEVFCGCICLFHAASHWKPTVILQLDKTSRPFSSFVISYWWSPNLQQRFCLLLPRYVPWHSVLLSFFPFLLHQPSRSSNIFRVMFQPFLLQMPSNFLSSAGFMARGYLKWRVWESSLKHSAGGMSQSEQRCFCSLFSLLVVFVWLGFCPPGRSSLQCIWLPVHLYCGVTQLSA